MAGIPEKAALGFADITPAEIKVYSFYCTKRETENGGAFCPDSLVAQTMKLSRNRVNEARNLLEKRGWIESTKKDFIKPLYGFETVENSTTVEISTIVENSTPFSQLPPHPPIRNILNNSVSNETGDETPPSNNSLLRASAQNVQVGQRIWTDGVELLKVSGETDSQVRKFLGGLAKRFGNELLAQCIAITQAKNPASPKEFLIGTLQFQKKLQNGTNVSQPVFSTEMLANDEAAFLAELKRNEVNANV